jgi:hypothetical protein
MVGYSSLTGEAVKESNSALSFVMDQAH